MARKEFSPTTKSAAFKRAKGLCGECQQPLQPGKIQYDHILPDALGGKPELANCLPMCVACHKIKTTKQDIPRIKKADRQSRDHIGARKEPTMKKAPKEPKNLSPLGVPKPLYEDIQQ